MDYAKLLQPFCADGAIRPNLQIPYLLGDYVYATDSYCMCRIKATLFDEHILDTFRIGNRIVPLESANFFNHKFLNEGNISHQCINESHYLEVDEKKETPCSECDGMGCVDCSCCGQSTDCDECNGKGYTEENTGNKIKIIDKTFGFWNTVVAGYLFEKVNNLARELGVQSYKCFSSEPLAPLSFVMNENIEALVMPLKSDTAKHIIFLP